MTASGLKTCFINLSFCFWCAVPLCIANAQSGYDKMFSSVRTKINTWDDSISNLKPRHRPVYMGFDISIGVQQNQIKSNIEKINALPVKYFGGMVAGVLANPLGKIKGGIGMYRSGNNIPFSFDLTAANLTVNLYVLRIKEIKYHTIEPYIFAGVSQMRIGFYGNYLTSQTNLSMSEQPYLGNVDTAHALVGAGAEYQLENDSKDFIHLYAELSYGTNVYSKRTESVLAKSSIPNCFWMTVGMSFGKFNHYQ
jgi:hypothetical protein